MHATCTPVLSLICVRDHAGERWTTAMFVEAAVVTTTMTVAATTTTVATAAAAAAAAAAVASCGTRRAGGDERAGQERDAGRGGKRPGRSCLLQSRQLTEHLSPEEKSYVQSTNPQASDGRRSGWPGKLMPRRRGTIPLQMSRRETQTYENASALPARRPRKRTPRDAGVPSSSRGARVWAGISRKSCRGRGGWDAHAHI